MKVQFWGRLVLAVMVLVVTGRVTPIAAQGTSATEVRVDPAAVRVAVGETVQVAVAVRQVQQLYAADLRFSFDPDVVEVQDANPSLPGVQVAAGTFLNAGFVVRNEADNRAGTVQYAMTQLNPSEPKSGNGNLIVITLRGKAASASSPLTLTTVQLAQRDGTEISAQLVAGMVEVVRTAPAGPTNTPIPTQGGGTPLPTASPNTPEPTTGAGPGQESTAVPTVAGTSPTEPESTPVANTPLANTPVASTPIPGTPTISTSTDTSPAASPTGPATGASSPVPTTNTPPANATSAPSNTGTITASTPEPVTSATVGISSETDSSGGAAETVELADATATVETVEATGAAEASSTPLDGSELVEEGTETESAVGEEIPGESTEGAGETAAAPGITSTSTPADLALASQPTIQAQLAGASESAPLQGPFMSGGERLVILGMGTLLLVIAGTGLLVWFRTAKR